MQLFDSCSWFGGLVFVSLICSVVLDLQVDLMANVLPSPFNSFTYTCCIWCCNNRKPDEESKGTALRLGNNKNNNKTVVLTTKPRKFNSRKN